VLIDLRLAALRHDPLTCAGVLRPPGIDATAVSDRVTAAGCGWSNAVRVRAVAGIPLSIGTISCPMAASLALWLAHEVQPLADRHLGSRVARVMSLGSFSCRNIVGSPDRTVERSEHASANAIDIAGFVLADGRRITVSRDWRRDSPEGRFLREAHRRACRYFRVALSPEYNAAHRDHFHLDRGELSACT
jgi:hypothetical protein